MLERDHLMRQVHMLAQALAHAMSLRADRRDGEALKYLDQTFADLSGENDGGLSPHQDLFALTVAPDGELKPFAVDVASLLTLRGDILTEQGKTEAARINYESALRIYRTAVSAPSQGLPWDVHDRIDGLRERLQDGGWRDD
jgi:hypothetical protein